MSDTTIKRALIAVYDKTGIADFARALVDEFGVEIISTGGTAAHLEQAGIPVTMVEQVTGFPEMLDGRVKTLHPGIHAAILADRGNPDHMRQIAHHRIRPIDMVVVNLYPFEQTVARPGCTFDEAVEMIDIGGPCLLRAAAKNHKHVLVVPAAECCARVLNELRHGGIAPETRREFAAMTFAVVAGYNAAINRYLQPGEGPFPATLLSLYDKAADTRYGENPDQCAAVYRARKSGECSLLPRAGGGGGPLISGDGMSFNNYVDGDAALSLVRELARARLAPRGVAFIKHTNACGCAIGDDPTDTYRRAYLGDPIAAAGGVLCMNFPVTREIADTVMHSFARWGKAAGAAFFKLDVWIATEFTRDAVELIVTPTEKRKWGAGCRLLAVGPMGSPSDVAEMDHKRITGGILVQHRDLIGLNEDRWQVVTNRRPTDAEMADLRFAWLVCKHTKSNAITICRDGMLLGNGAGQMSRVKSCDLAIQLAGENGHGDRLKGAVAAGDAFFPVPDGPQKLIDAGITAIIQPGGGNRDADTIAVCNAADVAMIRTGTRHFKH